MSWFQAGFNLRWSFWSYRDGNGRCDVILAWVFWVTSWPPQATVWLEGIPQRNLQTLHQRIVIFYRNVRERCVRYHMLYSNQNIALKYQMKPMLFSITPKKNHADSWNIPYLFFKQVPGTTLPRNPFYFLYNINN